MPLQDDIIRGGRDYPDSPALLFEGRTWSYRDLDALTDSMAANLISHGLHRGDRVALLFPNEPEIVFSYYACFKAGLISNRPGDENRPGSIGKPLPGVAMRLVDDPGADVQRGDVGEIVVQGDAR